jgi:hypothetical protein
VLYAKLASPELYAGGRGEDVAAAKAELAAMEHALEVAYARWLELESQIEAEG